ncbi:MAG: aminotransferase class V-fold PLP-dependent enzyme [Candidatus Nanopelagicales bacterium]|nr:aminotransferase class V-fold PLP-dependent enzyme [Candidatus Nanopelagicales bacterium]
MPTDPRSLRGSAPLLDAWLRFQESAPTPFTIPGHKQRHDLVGDVVAGDIPLYGGLDTMKLSAGVLAEAEARAARLWGADVCRFSTGGATHANQALALAVGGDGGTVIVSRTLHRSLLIGLVLAGLTPVWVKPEVEAATGLPLGVAPETLRAALAAHPEARAVFIGDPSYVGTVGDVPGLADAAHAHGVPLIVDAAWAAHFGFHPDLPPHPLQAGADAMVTSAHKTLPAWSQAALVLAKTERIDPARLDAGVEATATTSPAGAILASIDASRALLERDGHELLAAAIAATRAARDRLQEVDGLQVLDGPGVDPVKLKMVL